MYPLTNHCRNSKTLEIYNRIENNLHVNTSMMVIADSDDFFPEASEMVFARFEYCHLHFTAIIDVMSENIKVFIDVDDEIEEYGETTFEKLIDFLDSIPDINSIFI